MEQVKVIVLSINELQSIIDNWKAIEDNTKSSYISIYEVNDVDSEGTDIMYQGADVNTFANNHITKNDLLTISYNK